MIHRAASMPTSTFQNSQLLGAVQSHVRTLFGDANGDFSKRRYLSLFVNVLLDENFLRMLQRFKFRLLRCERYFHFCFVVAGTVSRRVSAHRAWLPIGSEKSYSVLNVFGSFGWKREGTVPEKIGHASILQRLQVCEIYTPAHAPVGLVIGATLLAVVNAQNGVAIFPHADSPA